MFIVSRVAGIAIMTGLMSPIVHTAYSDALGMDPEERQAPYLITLFITATLADQWARDNS